MNFKSYSFKAIIAILFLAGLGWWAYSNQAENSRSLSQNMENGEDKKQKRINAEERWKHEFEMLKDPKTGEIPRGVHLESMNAAMQIAAFKLPMDSDKKTLPTITITSKGPNNYGGRTRALGFDVRNNNIILSGGVSAGIFRSIDGGASWTRVTPAGVIHNLSCLAQDTRTGQEDTWYAGTGEINSSAGATNASYLGYGIYKSTDNGLTWTPLTATQTGSLEFFDNGYDGVHRIVVDPRNGNVFATALNSITRSTDGGDNWSTVLGSPSVAIRANIIYNAYANSGAGKFYAAIDGQSSPINGVWSSTTGASGSWTQERTLAQLHPTGSSANFYDVRRILLSNVANTDDIVVFYQLKPASGSGFTCTNGGLSDAGLQHFDGTSTWTNHTDKIGNCSNTYTAVPGTRPKAISLQDGYNMCITTKPNDANYVYFGGVEVYRYNLSTNVLDFIGGTQKGANTINLHVDNHLLMFEPGSNDIMWAANDGGLRKTDVTGTIKTAAGDDNGYDWTSRNSGYVTYQYYGADINPLNGSAFVAGAAQDNAFTIHPTNAQALEVGPTADGVDIAVISGDANFTTHNLLIMSQNGSMDRYENGSFAASDINPATTDFVGNFYLDADNTDYLYFPSASGDLYRTRISKTISSNTTTGNSATGWESLTGISTAVGSNAISAIDVSRNLNYSNNVYSASNASRKMYFGTKNGKVFRFDDPAFASAGTAPTDITPSGSSGYVSDVSVSPLNDKEILVTYSNYGVPSVWHTSDATAGTVVWTNVEGPSNSAVQLASARCAMITIHNNAPVYLVGTSTGLYATDALSGATTSWTRLGTTSDLGMAVCVEMRLRTSDNKILVATHGNGLFLLEFPNPLPVELIAFNGKNVDNDNLLHWITGAEKNNEGFHIEKSKDGFNFEKISFVPGRGTTSTRQNYSYRDNDVAKGISYYRLKQIDYNGEFEYSNVINVNAEAVQSKPFVMYPNPVKNDLTVENGIGLITIYDNLGKLILQVELNKNKEQINLSRLAKGTYMLNVRKKNGDMITKQFVK